MDSVSGNDEPAARQPVRRAGTLWTAAKGSNDRTLATTSRNEQQSLPSIRSPGSNHPEVRLNGFPTEAVLIALLYIAAVANGLRLLLS